MSENKYEERCRARADEFGRLQYESEMKIVCPALSDWPSLTEHSKSHWSNQFTDMARLSVQREAEAYRAGYSLDIPIYQFDSKRLEEKLQSLGLVPENVPDQEGSKV